MHSEQKARLEPIPPSEWDEEILDALGAFPSGLNFVLSRWKEGSDDARGRHMLGLLAHYPALAKAFLSFNKHVAIDSSLPVRERELLILRISWLKKYEYEFMQHIILGRRAGLTDDELTRIQDGPDAAGWSEKDADLINAADDMHQTSRLGDKTWERLLRHYDHRNVMDIIFLIGCYSIVGATTSSFNIAPEQGIEPLDPETRARMFALN